MLESGFLLFIGVVFMAFLGVAAGLIVYFIPSYQDLRTEVRENQQMMAETQNQLSAMARRLNATETYLAYLLNGIHDHSSWIPIPFDEWEARLAGRFDAGRAIRSRSSFRDKVTRFLSGSELKTLCFDLGIDYDELNGETKSERVVDLLSICKKNELMDDLVRLLLDLYPHEDWVL